MSERVRGQNGHFLMPVMRYCVRHPVLANLIWIAVLVVGALSSYQLNVQSMPDFPWPVISVRVTWPGANIGEIHDGITVPIASELRSASELRRIESFSRSGESFTILTFKTQTDLSRAFDEVRNLLAKLDMPRGSQLPIVIEETWHDPLLKLILYGDRMDGLRFWANEAKRTLLSEYNLDKVSIVGLTNQQLNVNMSPQDLHGLLIPIDVLAKQLTDVSEQQPIGRYETDKMTLSVRSQDKPKLTSDFDEKLVHIGQQAYHIRDMARLTYGHVPEDPQLTFKHQPAVVLEIDRATRNGGDSLKQVQRFFQWYKKAQADWPDAIKARLFLTEYELIQERVTMLLENGVWGVLGIFLILNFFLAWRVALWISLGIPTAILGALALMNTVGMSINYLSTFGFLIALGLIVDDTIVVAEHAYAYFQSGKSPMVSVQLAMNRMFPPVLASSVTTMAAFMPIVLMQSRYAIFLQDIPKVVIAVIAISLLECFFILPHHLHKGLQIIKLRGGHVKGWQAELLNRWHRLQFYQLKRVLQRVSRYAWVTLSLGFVCFILPIVLLLTHRVHYHFLPYIPRDQMALDVTFYPGTSKQAMQRYMKHAEAALTRADRVVSKGQPMIVQSVLTKYRLPSIVSEAAPVYAEGRMNHASLLVELQDPSRRVISNQQIKQQWLLELDRSPDVERMAIKEPQSETEWQDINLIIQGDDWHTLYQAAEFAKTKLRRYKDVFNITDNSSLGALEYEVSPRAEAMLLGVTQQVLATQIRHLLRGSEVTVNNLSGSEKLSVRVRMDPNKIMGIESLQSLPININGQQMTLADVAVWKLQKRPHIYYQYNGRLAIRVGADVVEQTTSANNIRALIAQDDISEIERRYNVHVIDQLESPDETDTMQEMVTGTVIGVVTIYFVLAWVARSYIWPIIMLMTIPLALSGAILGHYCTGSDFSLLSMIAVFGLSGVVINISIILFHQYRLCQKSYPQRSVSTLVIMAICHRFRAITLTTLTTTIGLTPLLLERSQQALWVQPFAVTIVFGLLFSVLLICLCLPACAAISENHFLDDDLPGLQP